MQAGDNQEGCQQTQISKAIAHEESTSPSQSYWRSPRLRQIPLSVGGCFQPLFQLGPGLVGIESGHLLCHIDGIFPKVLFEDHPVLVDDEALNTRIAVLR